MIISSSEIQLASSRQFVEKDETKENLTVWQNGSRDDNPAEEVHRGWHMGRGRAVGRLHALANKLVKSLEKISISDEAKKPNRQKQ